MARAIFFPLMLCAALAFGQEGPPAGRPSLRDRAAKGDAEAQFTLAKNYEAGRSGLKPGLRRSGSLVPFVG